MAHRASTRASTRSVSTHRTSQRVSAVGQNQQRPPSQLGIAPNDDVDDGVGEGLLLFGSVTIVEGSVLGPYSSVNPVTAGNVLPKKGGIVWDGVLPALSSHADFRTDTNPKGKRVKDDKSALEATVWTPPIPGSMQLIGVLTLFLLEAIAIIPGMALFYAMMFTWEVHSTGQYAVYWYALYHFFWIWIFGIPMCLLTVIYKRFFIGKFKEGPTTKSLDNKRWILQCLLQSPLVQTFKTYTGSCHALSWFYGALGAKIGWNAQVMPLFMTELDLLEVGESTSFGGQVSIFARDHMGMQRKVTIGHDTAVTNSACMMSGSSVGDGALLGDLTLLPVGDRVEAGYKCVGNPCVKFPGAHVPPEKNVFQSNWIAFLHSLAAIFLEVVSQPSWIVITFGLFNSPWVQSFSGGPGYEYGMAGFALIVVLMMLIMIAMLLVMVIFFKRITVSFSGTSPRDCWKFVQFIWMTKVIVNADRMLLRILSGTPWINLMYQFMGIDVSLSACMLNRHTADVDMLTVGDNAILAFDCYAELHQKTSDELTFEPIVVGDDAVVGARSILLRGSEVESTAQLHGLSMVLPGEPVLAGSVWGGLPAGSYYNASATSQLRKNASAVLGVSRRASTSTRMSGRSSTRVSRGQSALSERYSQRLKGLSAGLEASGRHSRKSNKSISVVIHQEAEEADIGMVVVGAGNMGLMAAYEFMKGGESVLVLEKTDSPFGCWKTNMGANPTSHVAVTEPAYRFPLPESDNVFNSYPSDYTPQPELLDHGWKFIKENNLEECINYGCTVTDIEHISSAPPRVKITYYDSADHSATKTVIAHGVYIAIGAQQHARELVWRGEDEFLKCPGTHIGYGIKGDVDARLFKGKRVVIVGNGAFAVENTRTALMHGATHVTLVFRRAFQTWPRVVHYLASLGGKSFGEFSKHYEAWKEWAGMNSKALGKDGMDIFMSMGTFSQPSASDFIFGAHKAGMLTIKKDEVAECVADVGGQLGGPGVVLKHSGEMIPCDIFLKTIGWRMPDLQAIMPSFKTRKWCFLNNTPNIVFACDPHYQLDEHNTSDSGNAAPAKAHHKKLHKGNKKVNAKMAAARHEHMMNVVPKGGTFSNIVLARATARMQLFMMTKKGAFDIAMTELSESTSPMCSWFEQRWEFDNIPQLNRLIDEVLEEYKDFMKGRFPDTAAFMKMANDRWSHDMSKTKVGDTIPYPMNESSYFR